MDKTSKKPSSQATKTEGNNQWTSVNYDPNETEQVQQTK